MGVKLVASSGGSVELVPTNTASNFTVTVPAATTTMVGTDATQTLTNKTSTTFGVGNATPANSGAGITFPAAVSASTDANTLDDYEEGTWTPKCGDGTTNISSVNKAVYTKVGKLVTIELDCTVNNPNPTNNNYITNLPFPGSTGAGNGGTCVGYTNASAAIGFHVTSTTTTLYAFNLIANATQNLAGVRVIFSFSYTTSS